MARHSSGERASQQITLLRVQTTALRLAWRKNSSAPGPYSRGLHGQNEREAARHSKRVEQEGGAESESESSHLPLDKLPAARERHPPRLYTYTF